MALSSGHQDLIVMQKGLAISLLLVQMVFISLFVSHQWWDTQDCLDSSELNADKASIYICNESQIHPAIYDATQSTNSSEPVVKLILYAQGEPYESSRNTIARSVQGSVDEVIVYDFDKLMNEFPEFANVWRHQGHRPACAGWKSVLVYDAFKRAKYGDWIIWADSSKYFTNGIQANLKQFVARLENVSVDAYPGTALCGISNVDHYVIAEKTFELIEMDIPYFWYMPHFQDNFFAFKKNTANDLFLSDFVLYSTNMSISCESHTNDQAVFSLLVAKHRVALPVFNLCDFGNGKMNTPHCDALKNVDFVVGRIESGEAPLVDNIISLLLEWRRSGWTPGKCTASSCMNIYN